MIERAACIRTLATTPMISPLSSMCVGGSSVLVTKRTSVNKYSLHESLNICFPRCKARVLLLVIKTESLVYVPIFEQVFYIRMNFNCFFFLPHYGSSHLVGGIWHRNFIRLAYHGQLVVQPEGADGCG
jgi:hypothetical protein